MEYLELAIRKQNMKIQGVPETGSNDDAMKQLDEIFFVCIFIHQHESHSPS